MRVLRPWDSPASGAAAPSTTAAGEGAAVVDGAGKSVLAWRVAPVEIKVQQRLYRCTI